MARARAIEPARIQQPMSQTTDELLRKILTDVLGLKAGQADTFTPATGLFGDLPELDSMAVAGLLTEMEDRLDIVIEDDEVDGELLETYGSLLAFAEAKRPDA
jgi:acyl carrier protein